MTAPRAQALLAALKDLARDLEADLAKAARYRGYNGSTTSLGTPYRDPGETLDRFEEQKATFVPPLSDLIASYRSTAGQYAERLMDLSPDDRATIIELKDRIQSVTTHDDAAALVASL